MQLDITQEFIDELKAYIADQNEGKVLEILDALHPADIAAIYDDLDIEEARYTYLLLDPKVASDVLVELEEEQRTRFLKVIPSELIAHQFIENMDSDDAADIIQEMTDDKREDVLNYVKDNEQAGDIVDLLNFEGNTAGGLMAKELIAINENLTLKEALGELRDQAQDIDEIYYLYVIDDDNKLLGVVSLKDLLFKPTTSKVSALIESDIISVRTDTDSEEVAQIMEKYDLVALPVVDSIGRLAGRITIDDVVDVIREEAERDYQLISGITHDVEPTDNVWTQVKSRIPWLLIGLFGGIMGALVIGYYEGDLAKYAGIALFLPLIAAMGGNAGVQSSAIIVQGLAGGTMDIRKTSHRLIKEMSVGILNGLICSSLIFSYNLIFSESFALTISVSIALFIVIIFATTFGALVPLILERFKIDPALATGPFITTFNDIMGLMIYLMLARMIFNMV
ncbi:MAG TPA: magnesium transporter [Bacteroidales bacterium]|nr:magnesium transporter [Bacteroidales bacterium]